jgi:hypothetical protein
MQKQGLIVTTIFEPNQVLAQLAVTSSANSTQFIVVGDAKSPSSFSLPKCDYYDIRRQEQSGFSYAPLCPKNHYARKNIGYLVAISQGCDVIIETDDDNYPTPAFWAPRTMLVSTPVCDAPPWVNVYLYFTEHRIWPRGFPLTRIASTVPPIHTLPTRTAVCPIQQGLADLNPDVDAIYRLTGTLKVHFLKEPTVALGLGSWCPFNSQNTTWFSPAFPLLYLPSTCSFRMTDIMRSFVAQRVCWQAGWNVLFHGPTVYQERNPHNLLKDFSDELVGYLNVDEIQSALDDLCLTTSIPDSMLRCYDTLHRLRIVDAAELRALEAWLIDCENLFALRSERQNSVDAKAPHLQVGAQEAVQTRF